MDSQQCIPILGVGLKPVTSGEGTAEAEKLLAELAMAGPNSMDRLAKVFQT
jgi:hypothetical protein